MRIGPTIDYCFASIAQEWIIYINFQYHSNIEKHLPRLLSIKWQKMLLENKLKHKFKK